MYMYICLSELLVNRTSSAFAGMSTSVMSDAMMMPVMELESQSVTSNLKNNSNNNEAEDENEENTEIVEFANCDCCGLTEECTRAYMERIKQRHQGKWICGLCSEAVKDEMARSQKLISCEEAMTRHTSFCKASRSPGGPPPNPTIHLISAMRKMLLKRVNSAPRSMPTSPMNKTESAGLFRSESCMPTLTLTVESSSSNESEEEEEHGDSYRND